MVSVEPVKLWMEKGLGFAGFVKYIYNAELMLCTIRPLVKIPKTLSVNNKERFVLLEPTESLFGKPCWWIQNGYPLSIKAKMYQTNFPIMVNNTITEKENVITILKEQKINESISKTIKANENDDIENIDIIEPEKINNWIKEYQITGKKALNNRTKRYSLGFNEFLKIKLENEKDTKLSFDDSNLERIVLEKVFLPMYHTSTDFQTYTQSGYAESNLSRKKITINQVVLYTLSLLLDGFIVYTIVNSIYRAKYGEL